MHVTVLANVLVVERFRLNPPSKKPAKRPKWNTALQWNWFPTLQKDYEIIAYSPNEDENRTNIATLWQRYVTRPFEYIDNTIGVEINFNKAFYKPEKLEDIQDILADLKQLENDLKTLENALALWSDIKHTNLRDRMAGDIPEHWEVKVKDLAYSITGLTYSPDDITDENEAH